MQIARNLSLNAVTRTPGGEASEVIDDRASWENTEDSAEARVMINAALDRLSESQREVVVLHAVSGLRLEEIARVTGQPLGTVKWRHSQAMKIIRAAMADGEEAAQ